ncbi:MAG: hypothetical protein KJ018_10400, partial [Burkholderiales bacterium]|nr:hypothetical protein [Burkholderiales bacterium]
ASPGPDTITFSVAGTITLTSGQIAINEALTITGPGAANLAIDGNLASRVFSIFEQVADPCVATGPDFQVAISGVRIARGRRLSDSVGGAIYSEKSLALQGVVLEDNRAKGGGAIAWSLLHAGQTLAIDASQLVGNVATPLSAVTGFHNGGALFVTERCAGAGTVGAVTITDSLLQGNRVRPVALWGFGGAISTQNYNVDLTIARSRIVDNAVEPPDPPVGGALYFGGGVYGRGRTIRIEDTEISDNAADRGGGLRLFSAAAALQTPQQAVAVALVNTTVSGNVAFQSAGAMELFGNVAVEIHNSTLAGNVADPGRTGGIVFNTGATSPPTASNALAGTLKLVSSIVGASSAGTVDIATAVATIPAFTVDATDSLIGRLCVGCGALTVAGSGNLLGMDPLLGALASNGGPTRTRLPQLGSPVIDRGSNPLGLANDQRGAGFARVVGAAADMGSAEYVFAAQCDGFGDVTGDSPFCPSVSWMKNRSVTTGCGGGNYCPSPDVSRLAMAAFMQRLGTSISGGLVMTVDAPGLLDFATAPVVCQTSPIAASAAPRRAVLDMAFSGVAGAASFARARVVVSADNGATWSDLQTYWTRATFLPNAWRSVHGTSQHDVEAGAALRYGIRIDSGAPPTVSGVLDSTCRLRVRLENSTGFTPI